MKLHCYFDTTVYSLVVLKQGRFQCCDVLYTVADTQFRRTDDHVCFVQRMRQSMEGKTLSCAVLMDFSD